MRSGMPASVAASAGRMVRSRIQIECKRLPPQQRHQPDQIDAALQFRSGMLEIDRLGDARFGREQFLGARSIGGARNVTRSARSGRRDGADERQDAR